MARFNRQTAYQSAYNWYLGSEFWRAKRNEAMARAKYVCQRCHIRPATEVHHLTYMRVFNELQTDLQPVCSQCHREIHARTPANDNDPGQSSLPFPISDND